MKGGISRSVVSKFDLVKQGRVTLLKRVFITVREYGSLGYNTITLTPAELERLYKRMITKC